MTLTFFLICVALVFYFCVLLILYKYDKINLPEFLLPILILGIIFVTLFGLIIFPITLTCESKTEIKELNQYEYTLLSTDKEIVLETRELQHKYPVTLNSHYGFNSYKAVTEYNENTKFYLKSYKSFYGVVTERIIVWSNPPYEIYFTE
jgi:hypothetical protein